MRLFNIDGSLSRIFRITWQFFCFFFVLGVILVLRDLSQARSGPLSRYVTTKPAQEVPPGETVPAYQDLLAGFAILRWVAAAVGIIVIGSFLGSLLGGPIQPAASCATTLTSQLFPSGLRGMCVADALAETKAQDLPAVVRNVSADLSAPQPVPPSGGVVLSVEAGVVVSAETYKPI